ncbi:MAG: hypothetical protein LBH91_07380 [Prevotellaceae bacterium]|jgi:hypothetical protein|nr:hypothetical protein [Prevotellaceae bacterium]
MKVTTDKHYTVITADEGKIFTDLNGNIVAKEIYLGNIDMPENYTEIDEPDAEINN